MKKDSKIQWRRWEKLGEAKAKGGLGFEHLKAFNKTLLAKYIWRILQYPDSLAAHILRSKNFSNGNVEREA